MSYKQVLSFPFPPFIDRQQEPLQAGWEDFNKLFDDNCQLCLAEFRFIKVDLQRFTFIFKLGPQGKSAAEFYLWM